MRKLIGVILLVLLACSSCKNGKNDPTFKVQDGYSKEKKVVVEEQKKLGRATTILWINKDEAKSLRGLTLNIKCRVLINEDGSITILEYEKEQNYDVKRSLTKYLKTYRVQADALKDGTVKTGEQVVFLRYVVLR